jgi:hypothetical protein
MSDKKKYVAKKLNDVEYIGPVKTFTESLTSEEIKDLLDGYKETPYLLLKKGHLIRYFIKDKETGKFKFRLGGNILNIYDNFIVVYGKHKFSVQFENTIFWQQTPLSEIKEQIEEKYKDELIKKDDDIKIKNNTIDKMYEEIISLKKKIKLLEKKIK